ncbi:MAG: hypothetical protein ABI665_18695 [Vicinamibacterales bacterium]
MKKVVVGCLIVLLVGVVGFGVAGFWAYRAAKPMFKSASNYLDKAREVASLGDRITIKSPYTAPADGELTSAQVDRFVAVQSRVRLQLGDRWAELQAKSEALKKKADGAKGELSFSEAARVFSDFTGLYMEARRAQVNALNVQKFSESEYTWVRNRVYEAAGMELAGSIDMSALEKMARDGAGHNGVQIPNIPKPHVPENNLKLVKPHLGKLKESIPLAILGL